MVRAAGEDGMLVPAIVLAHHNISENPAWAHWPITFLCPEGHWTTYNATLILCMITEVGHNPVDHGVLLSCCSVPMPDLTYEDALGPWGRPRSPFMMNSIFA